MKQAKFHQVEKPWLSRKEIETIKIQLKKDGWIPMGNYPCWETYLPTVLATEYKNNQLLVFSYNHFVKEKYNENISRRRKIYAKKFIFDRLQKI